MQGELELSAQLMGSDWAAVLRPLSSHIVTAWRDFLPRLQVNFSAHGILILPVNLLQRQSLLPILFGLKIFLQCSLLSPYSVGPESI